MAALSSDVSPRETSALNEDAHEFMFPKRGCCSWMPCFGSEPSSSAGSVWWQRIGTTENEDPWWSRGWKKVREWSELVAGPKWKTFIRRFNKKPNAGGYKQWGKFQYDPSSYALNFDEGPGHNGQVDDDYLHCDFSCRYASIPVSAKSSMDLGKDGPAFT